MIWVVAHWVSFNPKPSAETVAPLRSLALIEKVMQLVKWSRLLVVKQLEIETTSKRDDAAVVSQLL